jgi:hypothetical protein
MSEIQGATSVPGFGDFSPEPIAWQDEFIDDVLCKYDYGLGVHECLLSGAYGSSKTMAVAHLAVRICLTHENALGVIARRTLGDLRDTLYRKIRDHLRNDTQLLEGIDYVCVDSICSVRFPRTRSEIIGRSWHENDYESVRSLDLTFAIIEEATELEGENQVWYEALMARIGRTAHIKMALCLLLTNPGDPEHFLYKRFHLDLDENPEYRNLADTTARPMTRHVYYSVTKDNPFLPSWYYDQQLESLDPEEAERLLHGRWRPIRRIVVYHQYVKPQNYRNIEYALDPRWPVRLTFDFNIGEGKPMSAAGLQYDESADVFHIFKDFVRMGFNTEALLEEIADDGFFNLGLEYVVHGDATGRHRDTRNNRSDWEIVHQFLAKYRTPDGHPIRYRVEVPWSNPRIRHRHIRVNAYLCNGLGRRRMFVYVGAQKVDEGLQLTKLKKTATMIEDDSKDYQHVTTALGYAVCSVEAEKSNQSNAVVAYM